MEMKKKKNLFTTFMDRLWLHNSDSVEVPATSTSNEWIYDETAIRRWRLKATHDKVTMRRRRLQTKGSLDFDSETYFSKRNKESDSAVNNYDWDERLKWLIDRRNQEMNQKENCDDFLGDGESRVKFSSVNHIIGQQATHSDQSEDNSLTDTELDSKPLYVDQLTADVEAALPDTVVNSHFSRTESDCKRLENTVIYFKHSNLKKSTVKTPEASNYFDLCTYVDLETGEEKEWNWPDMDWVEFNDDVTEEHRCMIKGGSFYLRDTVQSSHVGDHQGNNLLQSIKTKLKMCGRQLKWSRGNLMNHLRERVDKHSISLTYNFMLWSGGIVPYVLDETLAHIKNLIWMAMRHIEEKTENLVRFVPRTNEDIYIYIFQGDGNWATRGMSFYGKQELSIARHSENFGVILHELMHSLGFGHEHQRYDRDDYLKIFWKNIKKDKKKCYEKNICTQYGMLDPNGMLTPFDFDSIMLYPPDAFSRKGKKTWMAKDGRPLLRFEDINGLSQGDVKKIQILYGPD